MRTIDGERAAYLELQIKGSAGEFCTDLMVNDGRPDEPTFRIKTKKGKLVESGKFEYGLRLHLRVLVASTIQTRRRIPGHRRHDCRTLQNRPQRREHHQVGFLQPVTEARPVLSQTRA